jgi:hypothetical protein
LPKPPEELDHLSLLGARCRRRRGFCMDECVTVCAQSFEILESIVGSVAIAMMNMELSSMDRRESATIALAS